MAHWRLILVRGSTTVEPCQCDEGYHECCLHGSLPVARPRATEEGDSIQRPMSLKNEGKILLVDEPSRCILRGAYLKDTSYGMDVMSLVLTQIHNASKIASWLSALRVSSTEMPSNLPSGHG